MVSCDGRGDICSAESCMVGKGGGVSGTVPGFPSDNRDQEPGKQEAAEADVRLSLPRLYGRICTKRINCSRVRGHDSGIIGRFHKILFDPQSICAKLQKSGKIVQL